MTTDPYRYTDKTNAELDALAAKRMGRSCKVVAETVFLEGSVPFSPTTDANDRDEWVGWLRDEKGLVVRIELFPEGLDEASIWPFGIRECIAMEAGDAGRAVVIAGLRATDE